MEYASSLAPNSRVAPYTRMASFSTLYANAGAQVAEASVAVTASRGVGIIAIWVCVRRVGPKVDIAG